MTLQYLVTYCHYYCVTAIMAVILSHKGNTSIIDTYHHMTLNHLVFTGEAPPSYPYPVQQQTAQHVSLHGQESVRPFCAISSYILCLIVMYTCTHVPSAHMPYRVLLLNFPGCYGGGPTAAKLPHLHCGCCQSPL